METTTVTSSKPLSFWSLPALWPPVAATLLLLVLVGTRTYAAIQLNNGHLIYPIDDAYGHMAIAKNLVRHWVWGFSALNGFSSACSSLLWPWVVAVCYATTGVHECTLYILNLVVAAGLLFYTAGVLRRYTDSGWMNFLILAAIVFLAPLPAVVATGMEHSLQALLSVMFVDLATRVLTDDPSLSGRIAGRWLLVSGCLLVLTRYEGLFLVAIVGALLLCRRRWSLAVWLGVVTATPLVLFGAYSIFKGWYPLPNSLLIKGNTTPVKSLGDLVTYFGKTQQQWGLNPHIRSLVLAMVVALVVALRRHRTLWAGTPLLLLITLLATGVHLQYAGFGWFYRYEAYLVVLGVLALGAALVEPPPLGETAPDRGAHSRRWLLPYAGALTAALLLLGNPLLARAVESLNLIKLASHNIYEQQFQMGLFLRHFYQGKGVVVNDIGAIDYLGEFRLYDIVGLADIDVLRAKRAGNYDHEVVQRLMAKYDPSVIAVYDTWANEYGRQLPEWTPVGEWTIQNNVICGFHTVVFYAPKPSLIPELTQALQGFTSQLPKDVVQSGLYCGGHPADHVIGTYGPETDGSRFYWTGYAASFFLYPKTDAVHVAAQEDAMLDLTVSAAAPGVRLDVVVNEEVVGSATLPPEKTGQWTKLSFKVNARDGLNTVRIVGHGAPAQLPTDSRKLLFALREPEWVPVPAAP